MQRRKKLKKKPANGLNLRTYHVTVHERVFMIRLLKAAGYAFLTVLAILSACAVLTLVFGLVVYLISIDYFLLVLWSIIFLVLVRYYYNQQQ